MSEGNFVKLKQANKICGSFSTPLGDPHGCGEHNNPNSIGLLPGFLVSERNGPEITDASGPGSDVIPFAIRESGKVDERQDSVASLTNATS